MAYAASVTTNLHTISGRRYLVVTCAETEAAATSEWSFECPFRVWTLRKYKATHTSGSGATINPRLGKATAWTASTQNDVGTQDSTAAHINDDSKVVETGRGSVYVRSQVDSGTDNEISTTIVIVEGVD